MLNTYPRSARPPVHAPPTGATRIGATVRMPGLFDLMKYDAEDPGARVNKETALELGRLANLFLLSAITLALFVLRALADTLSVSFIPQSVSVAWGVVLLTGWAATLVYGVYVSWMARRWGWLVLCLVPVTCVPAAVAYAWIRRREIERTVLGGDRSSTPRRPRGDRTER